MERRKNKKSIKSSIKNSKNKKGKIYLKILFTTLVIIYIFQIKINSVDLDNNFLEIFKTREIEYLELCEDNLKNETSKEKRLAKLRFDSKYKIEEEKVLRTINNIDFEATNVAVFSSKENILYNLKGKRNNKIVPASIAKLFTIQYIVENFDLNQKIIVKDEIDKVEYDESQAGIKKGETYTVLELIYMMLLPSGNDATYTLSRGFLEYNKGKESKKDLNNNENNLLDFVKEFSNKLNEYLKNQNINNTNITNPSGISKLTFTTKEDLAKLSKKIIKNEQMLEITKKHKIIVKGKELENTNKFLNPNLKIYNPKVKGLKTGSLTNNKNIAVLYEKNDQEKYIIYVLGAKTETGRYEDSKKVIEVIENEIFSTKSK